MREELSQLVEFRYYKSDDVLFQEDTPADAIYVVCSGGVKLTKDSDSLLTLRCQSAVLGLPGVLSRSFYCFTATVLVDSTIAVISARAFHEFLSEHSTVFGLLSQDNVPTASVRTGRWIPTSLRLLEDEPSSPKPL